MRIGMGTDLTCGIAACQAAPIEGSSGTTASAALVYATFETIGLEIPIVFGRWAQSPTIHSFTTRTNDPRNGSGGATVGSRQSSPDGSNMRQRKDEPQGQGELPFAAALVVSETPCSGPDRARRAGRRRKMQPRSGVHVRVTVPVWTTVQ
jgi:hypothetical protein